MRLLYGAPPTSGHDREWEDIVKKRKIDPPPQEAVSETAVIAALEALDAAARTRVLRYALSRWTVRP